jgi:hypothetical protein
LGYQPELLTIIHTKSYAVDGELAADFCKILKIFKPRKKNIPNDSTGTIMILPAGVHLRK